MARCVLQRAQLQAGEGQTGRDVDQATQDPGVRPDDEPSSGVLLLFIDLHQTGHLPVPPTAMGSVSDGAIA